MRQSAAMSLIQKLLTAVVLEGRRRAALAHAVSALRPALLAHRHARPERKPGGAQSVNA
jgi:hypothetical protein